MSKVEKKLFQRFRQYLQHLPPTFVFLLLLHKQF